MRAHSLGCLGVLRLLLQDPVKTACGGGLCGPSQSPCITPSGAVTLRVPLLYLTQRAKKRKERARDGGCQAGPPTWPCPHQGGLAGSELSRERKPSES